MSRARWRSLAAATLFTAAGIGAYSLWRAQTALTTTATRAAQSKAIPFRAGRYTPQLARGFETIATPASFRDAAAFGSLLYVIGPTGLYGFDETGAEVARYRPGIELPPVPLTAIATGAAGDSARPELWIGTAGEGLLAFDGASFRQIRAELPEHRKITALLALKTGRIAIGTERAGVLVYDGRTLAPFHDSLAAGHVSALAGDDTSLWAGTVDRGLLHWHAGELRTIGSLPDPQILSVALEGDTAYAGTPSGVAEVRDGKVQRVLGPGLVAQAVLSDGATLFTGTLEEGIFEIPLEARRARTPNLAAATAPMSAPESVTRIFRHGEQVLAVAAAGVYTAERRGSWRKLFPGREAAQLADRNIAALSADASGRLWIGYFDRGLDLLDGAGRVTHTEDDHVFCVNRIAQDPERGMTAVATANGLVLFDGAGRQRQVLTRADGLIASHVTDVLPQPGGGFAIATPAGLTLMDSSGLRSLYAFHGLVNNHAYTLAGAGSRLLAGTLGGLSVLDSGVVRANYTTGNSRLKHNWITAIVPADGAWFAGTYGAGVLRFTSTGDWSGFDDLKADSIVNPNSMAVTAKAVYAGTLGRGLLVWRTDSRRWMTVDSGLPSLNVTALAAGGGNTIYIGTDNGLVRVPEEVLLAR